MPVPKKTAARRRRATAASAADARDAIIAEHMARTQLALCQQAEMFTTLIVALRGLTEQTAVLSAQVAALKARTRDARKKSQPTAPRGRMR